MGLRRERLDVTTDASGDATLYTGPLNGLLAAVYVDDGTGASSLADTADITITEAETGAALLTITNLTADGRYQPRLPTHDAAGAAISGGVDFAPVGGEIKVVVASGGDTKSGVIWFYVIT